MNAFDDLYQEIIMDHYRSPRGAARLDHLPDSLVMENPTCGDSIKLEVRKSEDGRIVEVRHEGQGCAISTASASLMTEFTRGFTIEEARQAAERFITTLRGEGDREALEEMGDLVALKGVAGLPARVKCATLSWHALLKALRE